MPAKFIACDLVVATDNSVYIIELCPALSCSRTFAEEEAFAKILKDLSPQKFKFLQAPQSPDMMQGDNVNCYQFERDANKPWFKCCSSGNISKHEVRGYLNKIILGDPNTQAALFIPYFQARSQVGPHSILLDYLAEEFRILLKRLFKRLKKTIEVVDAYPLGVACEQNKVLFWQLLKSVSSKLLIPKALFRFSTFDAYQIIKMNDFINSFPDEKVVIKPTNSTLSCGTLIIPKKKLFAVIYFIKNKSNGPLELCYIEFIQMVYSTAAMINQDVNLLILMQVEKFINFWLSADLNSIPLADRDFFLVEVFKQPKIEPTFTESTFNEVPELCIPSRGYFHFPNPTQPSQFNMLDTVNKVCFNKNFFPPGLDIPQVSNMSICTNFYTKKHKVFERYRDQIQPYRPRSVEYSNIVITAFKPNPEHRWVKKLSTMTLTEFIQEIRTANFTDRELMDYLALPTVQELNFENNDFCWSCFTMRSALLRCDACNIATYCNAACQQTDWHSFHKTECQSLLIV